MSLLCGLLLAAMPAMTHHAFAAQYDTTRNLTFKGTVTKVEWKNPHIYVYIDVKDDAGNVANWSFEGASATGLYRLGWKKDSLKPGDEVTVEGWRAKDGANLANMNVVMVGGKRVFAKVEGADETK